MNCACAQSGRGHNLRFCVFGNAPWTCESRLPNGKGRVGSDDVAVGAPAGIRSLELDVYPHVLD